MFTKEIYVQRRAELKRRVGEGIILLLGNNDAPNNYAGNPYRFRQDSCFLYYFGQKREGLVGVIDIDNDKEISLAMTSTSTTSSGLAMCHRSATLQPKWACFQQPQ